MKSKLFDEAILDAKAAQAAALANARFAMEEAFTPKLKSMLSAKLKEELGETGTPVPSDETSVDDDVVTSEEIDKILAELDGELKENDETDAGEEVGDAPAAPTADAPAAPAVTPVEGLGDVKTVEAPALVVAPGQLPVAPTADAAPVDADAAPVDADAPTADAAPSGEESDEEEINLEELLAELTKEEASPVEESKKEDCDEKEEDDKKEDGDKERLSEAMETIEFLRSQLKEVNLLNAKLLYVNRLFKAHALNQSQKMKIIESFDLAKSIREVKLTFNNLSEALNFGKDSAAGQNSSIKKSITEGFASKSVGTTKPVEDKIVSAPVNVMASRFQKLAGIKKK